MVMVTAVMVIMMLTNDAEHWVVKIVCIMAVSSMAVNFALVLWS